MKNLKVFNSQSELEAYMSSGEVVFPNVNVVKTTGEEPTVRYYYVLPNVDTTGYATTFESGVEYKKEANLFKQIVDKFLEGYDTADADPAIWMDLSAATVDVFLFGNRQTFSIENEDLYKNYLSKITNFCDGDGNPSSILNLFEDKLNVEEYTISGGSSTEISMNLYFESGIFE